MLAMLARACHPRVPVHRAGANSRGHLCASAPLRRATPGHHAGFRHPAAAARAGTWASASEGANAGGDGTAFTTTATVNPKP